MVGEANKLLVKRGRLDTRTLEFKGLKLHKAFIKIEIPLI